MRLFKDIPALRGEIHSRGTNVCMALPRIRHTPRACHQELASTLQGLRRGLEPGQILAREMGADARQNPSMIGVEPVDLLV